MFIFSTKEGRMRLQQKLIAFLFQASLAFLMFPLLVSTSQEHNKVTSRHSSNKHNSIKMNPRLKFEITLHGFVLWGSMGFLMPVGILAIRLSNREGNRRRARIIFYIHAILQESNLCELLRVNTERGVMLNDGKTRFSKNGQPIYHFVGTSTFSEYTVVHAGCVAKINPAAPLLDKVCVLSCGFCTGFGATVNVAKPKPDSSVAIFGLGAVGLAAAEGARLSGASRIIGVDLIPNRLEEAKKFGVTDFVNPKDHNKPVQQVIVEMTNGGVDRAVECTGNIQASIAAFECVHDGWGVAVLVGVPKKDDEFITNPLNFLNGRTLKGTFFGNYKPRTDLPCIVDKCMNKELEVEKFITHSVPFSEINKAFEYMLKGEGIRCIIRMEE